MNDIRVVVEREYSWRRHNILESYCTYLLYILGLFLLGQGHPLYSSKYRNDSSQPRIRVQGPDRQ